MPTSARDTHGPAYSRRFDRALGLAAIVHRDQVRKGTPVPYITHPFHVALILERHGLPERFLVAAVLHDVLEDIRPEDAGLRDALRETFPRGLGEAPPDPVGFLAALDGFLEEEFGHEVTLLVRGVTDRKVVGGRRLTTAEKRARKLAELRDPATDADVLVLKAADATHNARSIACDLQASGPGVMSRFNEGPEETLRWYTDIRDVAAERIGGRHPAIVEELSAAVRALAGELERSEAGSRKPEVPRTSTSNLQPPTSNLERRPT
jgi:(p)ppGpp synthase/HD superfamily hydrolase